MDIFVDGDILVYRAAFATEYPVYNVLWGGEYAKQFQYKKEATEFANEELGELPWEIKVDTVLEPEKNALHILDSMLGGIAHFFGVHVQELDIAITGTDNFRIQAAVTKPYKGNRTKPKPSHYGAVRDRLVDNYDAYVTEGEEADDYLGYSQYPLWSLRGEDSSCIVTIDKDLDMIPGLHYNFVKEQQYYVDEDEADRFFLHQLVSGDGGDNIPGIPGMAAKKAATFLKDVPTHEALAKIRNLYYDHFGEKADTILNEQATLLWIRRTPDQKWTEYWNEDAA